MFGEKKKLQACVDSLIIELTQTQARLTLLQMQWNSLVDRINRKGGETFLSRATLNTAPQLDRDDVRKLIQLCHPDKHGGSTLAVEMTQRLVQLKETV